MKSALLLGFVAVLIGLPQLTQAALPADNVYVVGVSGMTWSVSCPKKVRETLKGLKDVREAVVDFKAKTATVTMKGTATLDKATVEKALKDKGYGVTSFDKK